MPPLMPVGELHELALCLSSANEGCLLAGESPTGGRDMQDPAYGVEDETGTAGMGIGVGAGRLPCKGRPF